MTSEHRFYSRMTWAIALTIVFSFVQWSLRGFADPLTAPFWVHLHWVGFAAFLGLFITQQSLAGSGRIALHRRLGWIGIGLALAVAALTIWMTYAALRHGRVLGGFSNAFFLALEVTETLAFAGMVLAALALRRRTDWHRRLMFGSLVVILDPAIGRLLPTSLPPEWGDPVATLIQLAVVGLAMMSDRAARGRIHPANWCTAAVVLAVHIAFNALAAWPPFIAYADSLAR